MRESGFAVKTKKVCIKLLQIYTLEMIRPVLILILDMNLRNSDGLEGMLSIRRRQPGKH